jgi:pyruvate/2-oxoglutarate dehydrogenase complex dihydrolipoamide dehydrogenase (E3) component
MVEGHFSYSWSFALLTSVVAIMLSCCGTRALSSSSSSSARTYDVVVIGGGSAGHTAAKFAGNIMKKSVVIIEQAKLGGDCTWTGCVPSKSLIASAKASLMTRKQLIASSGSDSNYKADFAKVKETYRHHQQEIYDEDDSPEALTKLGVTTISGIARFISSDTFEVTTTTSSSSSTSEETKSFQVKANEGVILCTGATPKIPSIPGLDTVEYITYEQVWDLETLPKQLTVVGGGPVRDFFLL